MMSVFQKVKIIFYKATVFMTQGRESFEAEALDRKLN